VGLVASGGSDDTDDDEDGEDSEETSEEESDDDSEEGGLAAFYATEFGGKGGDNEDENTDEDEEDDDDGDWSPGGGDGGSGGGGGGSRQLDNGSFDEELNFDVDRVITIDSGDRASTTGMLVNIGQMTRHRTHGAHPERPQRLVAAYKRLWEAGIVQRCRLVPTRPASREDLCSLHAKAHVDLILYKLDAMHAAQQRAQWTEAEADLVADDGEDEDYETALRRARASRLAQREADGGFTEVRLDGDTFFTIRESAMAASLAAGSVIELTSRVVTGELRNALAITRPPGHHCEEANANGFCLLNNVALAARVAQQRHGLKRVLVLDWDIHHGNGIEHMFENDDSVLYVSLHRFGNGFFPGTGDVRDAGKGAGRGFNLNIPWLTGGIGDADYVAAFQRLIMPIAHEYAPELVIVAAGFDSGAGDPLGGCDVTPRGFAQMTAMLNMLAGGRLVVCLEGGYNLDTIATSTEAVARVLLGASPDAAPSLVAQPAAEAAIAAALTVHANYWKCFSYIRGLAGSGTNHDPPTASRNARNGPNRGDGDWGAGEDEGSDEAAGEFDHYKEPDRQRIAKARKVQAKGGGAQIQKRRQLYSVRLLAAKKKRAMRKRVSELYLQSVTPRALRRFAAGGSDFS